MIPQQHWEKDSDAHLPSPSVRSRRYVTKVMFMGIIARPNRKENFDGKIFLKRVSRDKIAQRKSEHQKFVPDGNLNELIKSGDWRHHIEPCTTVGELLDSITTAYNIDEQTSQKLAITYCTFPTARNRTLRKIVLDYTCEDEIVLEYSIKYRFHNLNIMNKIFK